MPGAASTSLPRLSPARVPRPPGIFAAGRGSLGFWPTVGADNSTLETSLQSASPRGWKASHPRLLVRGAVYMLMLMPGEFGPSLRSPAAT